MPASWKQLTFIRSSEALHVLREGWGWLIGESLSPFMCSASGDVFFLDDAGIVFWLDTGQGLLTQICANREEFLKELKEERGAEWLLAPVIDQLVDSGVELAPDQCFAYRVLPILGGPYSAENMVPMSAAQWYSFSGYMHSQIKDLPDGAKVEFKLDKG